MNSYKTFKVVNKDEFLFTDLMHKCYKWFECSYHSFPLREINNVFEF